MLYRAIHICIGLSDNIDFGSASGKFHFQILSAFAEFKCELIRERTLEGLRRAKMQGKKAGRPKGSKDTKRRKRAGYLIREATKRKKSETDTGINKPLSLYLN